MCNGKIMYYSTIKYNDIANGIGVRTSLFVSGCRHYCKGCFNQETWCFTNGEPYTKDVEQKILDSLRPEWINGLSLLGGEPFEPENQKELVKLLRKVKAEFPTKSIWAYTGGTLDGDLWNPDSQWRCEYTDELLSMIDILVDGPFVEELKNISLKFRGSSNQRIIDVKQSLKSNKVVLDKNLN